MYIFVITDELVKNFLRLVREAAKKKKFLH